MTSTRPQAESQNLLTRGRRPHMTHCRRRRSSLLALRYSYSINSSALGRIDVGTSRPSALAVVILSTVSYFTDNYTGRSAGFSLLRMRSTYEGGAASMTYLVRPIWQQTARASIVPSAVDRGQLVTGRKEDDRVAMPQPSCTRLHHQ